MYEEIKIPHKGGYIAGCWYGNRQERPLLALHGWQDNAGSFALLAPILSRYVPVLAIDFPGHGKSSHNPPGILYHSLDYVRAIRAIMLYFKWPKISLMGHSMGAAVSFHFSSLFPHLVDLLISIDILHTRYHPLSGQIYFFRYSMDKFLAETERKLKGDNQKKPLYTFEQLQELLYEASEKSIDIDKTKYILERNTTWNSEKNMFCFSRDGSIKLLQEYNTDPGLCMAMSKNLTQINWLVIKGGDSYHIDEQATVTKAIKQWHEQNNPNFVFHVLPGLTHHCHLNNPNEVAECILPFLAKYRSHDATIAESKL
ncbi:probable serine hydrolase [Musca domestica]|uniref:Probable serine hydrolase n=1 Tax=Musca domestica TaxID=7370 RepID=A0A1I8M6H9_MUSDO|nr:probable serine hydrolase [Musca domestica]